MLRSILLAAAVLGAICGIAFAHDGGHMPRPFLQRHAVMGSLAAHMKSAKSAMAAGELKAVAGQAEAIHWLARILPDIFPKGSGPEIGKTRASPKIWNDWQGFVVASNRLAETATTLKQAAESNNAGAARTEFKATVMDGCGGCHKVYRLPKQ
jgi:cytochrome c556